MKFDWRKDQIYCKRGHKFSYAFTYRKYGWRHCRVCRALAQKKYRDKDENMVQANQTSKEK